MKILNLESLSLTKKIAISVIWSLLYLAIGQGSLHLATFQANTSPVWPASGLAIGGVLLFGPWLSLGIFVGAFFTNLTVTSFEASLLVALGNTLEALLGAQLMLWVFRKSFLKNYSEFFAVAASAMIGSLVSSVIGISSLYHLGLIPADHVLYLWYTWWSGDTIGAFLIVPLFTEFYLSRKRTIHFSSYKLLLTLLLTVVMVGITHLVFREGFNQAYAWSLCPIFILAGIGIGRFPSRAILIVISTVVILYTTEGFGPFQFGQLNHNLIYTQCLLFSYASSILFVRPFKSSFKIGQKFLFGNFVGWTFLFVVIYIASNTEKKHMLDDLKSTIQMSLTAIEQAEEQYEILFDSTKALVLSKPTLTTNDWDSYVDSLKLETRFGAIHGLGFINPVEKKNLPAFKKEMILRGAGDINLKVLNKEYSDRFKDHFIMIFMAPRNQNPGVVGLDVGSERHRREAAWASKRLKETTATHNIHLLQDPKLRPGLAIYHPVWDSHQKFIGWIVAPAISQIFFEKSLGQFSRYVKIHVSIKGNSLYGTPLESDNSATKNEFYTQKDILIFGINHSIEFFPRPDLFGRNYGSLPFLAMTLCLFMMFISGFLLEQITFGQKAEALINERTKELEISKIQLIHTSKMASLGEMASGMAHEINNPLTIILGKISVIRDMLEKLEINHPALFEEIQKIKNTTARIGRIVKGLRTFSRGSNEDPFEPTPLPKVIQETLDLCYERLRSNDIDVQIDDIPKRNIICRPGQISQVLLNLLNNANDAIEDDENKWIRISFSIKPGHLLHIYVTDSGRGIPINVAERIMEPFFTTKEVRKGTGLGLSIAKNIVDSHGGKFWFDQNYPHTRFVIELPLEAST